MFSLRYPKFVHQLLKFPVGLFSVRISGEQSNVLVVKGYKELILTAKLLREFRVYCFQLKINGISTYGLVAAFFDDPDEPLVIQTLLMSEDLSIGLLDLLTLEDLRVHFFDEHNREFAAYRAKNVNADEFLVMKKNMKLKFFDDYSISQNIEIMSNLYSQLYDCFVRRNAYDDDCAIVIQLQEKLIPDDILHWNMRPENNSYFGSLAYGEMISLERKEPGESFELDIVRCILQVYSGDQVFLRPKLVGSGRELTDILIASSKNLLLIQAKDSPNSSETLSRTMNRKIDTITRHLKKAVRQTKGSISSVYSNDPLVIRTGDDTHTIPVYDLNKFALIIVRELFPEESDTYSDMIFDVIEKTGVACLILDYRLIHELTLLRKNEAEFIESLYGILRFTYMHDQYPMIRVLP